MGRRLKGEPPRYRLHKQSGQAVVSLPLGNGAYKDVLLGPFNTPESRQEYARIFAEWEANGQRLAGTPAAFGSELSINEVAARFWPHAEQHYRRPDVTTTNELADFKYSLRPLKHFYGHTAAKEFGPLSFLPQRKPLRNGPERGYCILASGNDGAAAEGQGGSRGVGTRAAARNTQMKEQAMPPASVPASRFVLASPHLGRLSCQLVRSAD